MNEMQRGLVVDDDKTYLATLLRSLERRGFAMKGASNGLEALSLARTLQPDFILLDLKLNEESGLDLVAPLRNYCPETYLVLVTGYASVATAVQAMKRGADDYLAKPVSIATIVRVLHGTQVSDADREAMMTPLSRLEWEHIQQALHDCDGNISAAARLLGMHRRSLQRKLTKRPSAESLPANR